MELTGKELKEEGIARVAENSEHFQDVAASAIEELSNKPQPFTAEDVRSLLLEWGHHPPHPNAMGAALNIAARRGIIERVGFKTADRGPAHSRVLAMWQGPQHAS